MISSLFITLTINLIISCLHVDLSVKNYCFLSLTRIYLLPCSFTIFFSFLFDINFIKQHTGGSNIFYLFSSTFIIPTFQIFFFYFLARNSSCFFATNWNFFSLTEFPKFQNKWGDLSEVTILTEYEEWVKTSQSNWILVQICRLFLRK